MVIKHIFVMDDEENIRELIKKYLEKEGFKVTTFNSSNNVYEEINRLKPDLLVLDIMVPGINGLELCKKIRKESDIPIIFVTARDEEIDRIIGLEIGGDDYLAKPFSPRELVIRIKNIFKRIDKLNPSEDKSITIKDIVIYLNKRYVESNGREIKFTNREYELFEFLALNKGIPFKREQLIEKIWGYDYIGDERMIDDLVKRIRKKLKNVKSQLEISTVWGFGYRMDE